MSLPFTNFLDFIKDRLSRSRETGEPEVIEIDFDELSRSRPEPPFNPLTWDTLQSRLEKNGFAKEIHKILPLARDTIHLLPRKAEEHQIGVGRTKIGGQPDLPPDLEWPSEKKADANGNPVYLPFVAQINLSELAGCDTENPLPKKGMLYFFYSVRNPAVGFDDANRESFKVLHIEVPVEQLSRRDFPATLSENKNNLDRERFKPCAVDFLTGASLPSWEKIVACGVDDDDERKLDGFAETTGVLDQMSNKMFGWADWIQSGWPMTENCDLPGGAFHTLTDEKTEVPLSDRWLLLLQIDSNKYCEMMWGDMGRIYFWIRESDLREQRFDRMGAFCECG